MSPLKALVGGEALRKDSLDSASVSSASSLGSPSPDALRCHLDLYYPLDSPAMQRAKHDVMARLKMVCEEWAHRLLGGRCTNLQLAVFGSFRLGVSQDSDDIDACLVVPQALTRAHFFDEGPLSLIGLLRIKCEVVLAIQTAYVPLIKLVWDGIEVDLVFASLSKHEVVPDSVFHELFDDSEAATGMDGKSRLSLGGVRVTEALLRLVSPPRREQFRLVLRTLRHWAKQRGLYNNKFGFWGGINFAIVATLVCQLHPTISSEQVLVSKAMKLVCEWPWPKPLQVLLLTSGSASLPTSPTRSRGDWMPILTPHVNSNSAVSVTAITKQLLLQDFAQSHRFILEQPGDWRGFFHPARGGFFHRFPAYGQVSARYLIRHKLDFPRARQWLLFVESRIRRLCDLLEHQPGVTVVFPHQLSQVPAHGDEMVWYVGLNLEPDWTFLSGEFASQLVRESVDPLRCVVAVGRFLGQRQ
ncbi:hypothetical protein BASA81_007306 [Batrachochytrium salamandrivorans]|nr:hypothetical protein BASA81_007306 [Batrachochytrium salamandrivorans]